jgi:hypothetical protein
MSRSRAIPVALAAFCCAGCSFYRSLVGTQTPAEHAHAIDLRCKSFQDAAARTLLGPEAIEAVEPAYSYVLSGNDHRSNLRGARLLVRPLPGLSAEALTRSLECHEASAVLRGVALADDDPYVLPGDWVNFDVSSEGDGFVVLARVLDIEEARLVLARAKRFVQQRATP